MLLVCNSSRKVKKMKSQISLVTKSNMGVSNYLLTAVELKVKVEYFVWGGIERKWVLWEIVFVKLEGPNKHQQSYQQITITFLSISTKYDCVFNVLRVKFKFQSLEILNFNTLSPFVPLIN